MATTKAIAKNIQSDQMGDLLKTIPKEHMRAVNKLIKLGVQQGRLEVLSLVQELGSIPVAKVTEYGIWHEDCLDGG